LRTPIDNRIVEIRDIPYTISYVIRKRQQIDGFNELPKEDRPPYRLIWESPPEELEEWLESIFNSKSKKSAEIFVSEDEIER
jgi:hypothetical protein